VSKDPALPYSATQVIKLYQNGIDKTVILNFVASSSWPFRLTADQIIYLQRIGLPQEVTQAMLQRDGQLQQQQMMQMAYQPPTAPAPQLQTVSPYAAADAQSPTVVVPQPAPQVTVIGSDYPYYGYDYPYYDTWGYWPIVGGGWGWGWGHGWYGHGYVWGHGGIGFHGGFGGIHGGFGGFHGGIGGGFHGGGFSGGHAGGFGGGGHGGGGHR
jgi:hypothetical protein